MHHFARVIVPESDVSVLVGGDGQRQRGVAHYLVDLPGVNALDSRGLEVYHRLARLYIENDAMRAGVRRNDAVRVIPHEIYAGGYPIRL